MSRAVRLTSYNLRKISVREWGIPTFCGAGKMWRSERHRTITCLLPLPDDPKSLRVEVRHLLIVDHAGDQWIPATWLKAAAVYAKAWPGSAPRLRRLPR